MDIRQLRYFISVANHLNFTAAAKELHIAQPYLGKQIAELEMQIGLKLFVRNTRNVELTIGGAELLKEAITIVLRAEAAVNKARLVAQGSVGSLKIGFLGPLEKEVLPKLIKKFRQSCPSCRLNFVKLGWGPLNDALAGGSLDIAFTMSYGLDRLEGVSWRVSRYSYPLALVVPEEHPLAGKDIVHISALADEDFVVLSRSECPLAYEHMRQTCIANSFYPRIVGEAVLLEALLLMVETGIGISIQTKHTAAYANPGLKYIDLDGCSFVNDYVVAWRKTTTNALVPLFLETVAKEHFVIE